MSRCNHTTLLEAYHSCIVNIGRLQRLTASLNDPQTQFPSVLLCVGGEEKRRALRHVFPGNNATKRPKGLANMYVDTFTANQENPVFFLDSDPAAELPSKAKPSYCHETKTYRIEWECPASLRFWDVLCARLLLLFADVVCVFADDLGGLSAVESMLTTWTMCGSSSTLATQVRPRVVVITSQPYSASVQLEQDSIGALACTTEFKTMFSSIRIDTFTQTASLASKYHPLRQELLHDELEQIRTTKQCHRSLFSACHLSWLFSHAIVHFSKTNVDPFNFFECFRRKDYLRSNLPLHSRTLLKISRERSLEFNAVASVIASSILLDAYPQGSHSKFSIDIDA